MKNAIAQLRYLRMAPRKVRLVIDVIRGMPVQEAEAQLSMMKKRAALPILKLLRSAIANAKNLKFTESRLMVSVIRVDQGPTIKRSLPRAKGSASPIHKMSSHVNIILTESEKEFKPARFIILQRKKKSDKEKSSATRAAKKIKSPAQPINQTEIKPLESPGFIRRVFRRKAGDK